MLSDKGLIEKCRIIDSITWLYLNGIIQAEERDRLLRSTESWFAKVKNDVEQNKGGTSEKRN